MPHESQPEPEDFNGYLQVFPLPSPDAREPSVYLFQRLAPRLSTRATCEGCGTSPKPALFITEPVMYEVFALHRIDGFGDATQWCHRCATETWQDRANARHGLPQRRWSDETYFMFKPTYGGI